MKIGFMLVLAGSLAGLVRLQAGEGSLMVVDPDGRAARPRDPAAAPFVLEDPTMWFAELKAGPQTSRGVIESPYHDMHGNPDRGIVELKVGRFRYTAALCKEIEATDPRTHPLYLGALYEVLAKVCDPQSIPWLEEMLKSRRRNEVLTRWLPHFGTSERWLEDPGRWAAFLEKWATSEPNAEVRTRLGWAMWHLETPRALGYFKRLAGDRSVRGEPLLTALLYLRAYGEPLPAARITEMIDTLRRNSAGRSMLAAYLGDLGHESALPWLIKVVRTRDGNGDSHDILTSLAKITLRPDLETPQAWRKWADEHRRESRVEWARQAGDLVVEMARKDPAAARRFIGQATSRRVWTDPIMLPTMERLVEFNELRDQIPSWIDLVDGEFPHLPGLAGRLSALVEKLRKSGEPGLESWGRFRVRPGEFLPSWEEAQRMHVF